MIKLKELGLFNTKNGLMMIFAFVFLFGFFVFECQRMRFPMLFSFRFLSAGNFPSKV